MRWHMLSGRGTDELIATLPVLSTTLTSFALGTILAIGVRFGGTTNLPIGDRLQPVADS